MNTKEENLYRTFCSAVVNPNRKFGSVKSICNELGICNSTYYRWMKRFKRENPEVKVVKIINRKDMNQPTKSFETELKSAIGNQITLRTKSVPNERTFDELLEVLKDAVVVASRKTLCKKIIRMDEIIEFTT